jgi:hypothetical protein
VILENDKPTMIGSRGRDTLLRWFGRRRCPRNQHDTARPNLMSTLVRIAAAPPSLLPFKPAWLT